MKRFILLKENHCYLQDLKNKKRYEYHFMVKRVGLKKSWVKRNKDLLFIVTL